MLFKKFIIVYVFLISTILFVYLNSPLAEAEYIRNRLPNGLKIILNEDHSVKTIAVNVVVRCGPFFETMKIPKGISYLLSRLLLSGTKNRPKEKLKEDIASLGTNIEIDMEKEYTYLYTTIFPSDLKFSLEIIKDILQNSIFPQDELNKQKAYQLSKIDITKNNPCHVQWRFIDNLLYGGHPLSNPYYGFKKSVENIKREVVFKYYKAYYTAKNTLIVISGDINTSRAIKDIEEIFHDFKKGVGIPYWDIPLRTISDKYRTYGKSLPLNQAKINLVIMGPGIISEDHLPAILINEFLSKSLFGKIRSRNGLAYTIDSDYFPSYNTGMWRIYTGVSEKNIKETKAQLFEEIIKIKEHGLSEHELIRAKSRVLDNLVYDTEKNLDKALWIGDKEIFTDYYTMDEYINAIMELSLEKVNKTAAKYLVKKNLGWVILEPD